MTSRTHHFPLLLLLASSLCFGQASNARINSTVTPGDISTSTLTAGSFLTSSGTTRLVWANGDATWSTQVAQSELRKDDGKGPTTEQVDNSAKLLAAAKLPTARYREIALSIGLNPSPITDEADILDAIASMGLKVYNWDQVDGYLYRKALRQKSNTRWVWKPLRESDQKAIESRSWTTIERVGMLAPKQYAQAIPENVLEQASNFLAKVPKAVLLVSDYEVINPDPFLAVTTEKLLAAGKIWIIERWDEPGFREVPTGQMVTARAGK